MKLTRLVDWLVDQLALLPTLGIVSFVLSSFCTWVLTRIEPMPHEPKLYTFATNILTLGFWIFWMWLGWGFCLGRGGRNTRRWLAMVSTMLIGALVIAFVPHHGALLWIEIAIVAGLIVVLEDIHKKGDPPIVHNKRSPA